MSETATLRLKVSQLEAELKQSSEGHAASVEAMALRSATLRAEVSSLEEQFKKVTHESNPGEYFEEQSKRVVKNMKEGSLGEHSGRAF